MQLIVQNNSCLRTLYPFFRHKTALSDDIPSLGGVYMCNYISIQPLQVIISSLINHKVLIIFLILLHYSCLFAEDIFTHSSVIGTVIFAAMFLAASLMTCDNLSLHYYNCFPSQNAGLCYSLYHKYQALHEAISRLLPF